MPRKLSRIKITEGSVCRRGANQLANIMLFKSATGDAGCGCGSDNNKEIEQMPAPKMNQECASDNAEVMPRVDEIRKELKDEIAKRETDLAKAKAQIEEMGKALAAERDARLQRDAIEKASAMPVAGASVAEVAAVLRKARAVDEKMADELEKIFSACSKAIAASPMMKEIGSTGGQKTDSQTRVDAIIKSLRDKNPEMTEAEAMVKAYEVNPAVYDEMHVISK